MNTLTHDQYTIKGELSERLLRNYARLTQDDYQVPHLFGSLHGWPGDWPGRAILAVCRHAQLSGVYPPYIDAIMDKLEEKLADHGYLGPESNDPANEQSVSGHNWMLRGLLEHYRWQQDERSLRLARRLLDTRFLPLKGKYPVYPVDNESRIFDGDADGHLDEKPVNGWLLSTDIGCAYMSLDGLSEYYEMFHDEAVGALLEEMITEFMRIDFVGASMQTHASLAATRGILKMARLMGRDDWKDFAIRFFELYVREGMTATDANFNWFGRPLWTEPCAIVDSMILALELYQVTLNPDYLTWYNRIYFNALCFAQRVTGGFGCDECAAPIPGKEFLQVQDIHYEASWCCTMRGADGLVYAAEHLLLQDAGRYLMTLPLSAAFTTEHFTGAIVTEYPRSQGLTITITEVRKPFTLVVRDQELTITAPGTYTLSLEEPIREERIGAYRRYFRGPLVLAKELLPTGTGAAGVDGNVGDDFMIPYREPLIHTREEIRDRKFVILF